MALGGAIKKARHRGLERDAGLLARLCRGWGCGRPTKIQCASVFTVPEPLPRYALPESTAQRGVKGFTYQAWPPLASKVGGSRPLSLVAAAAPNKRRGFSGLR